MKGDAAMNRKMTLLVALLASLGALLVFRTDPDVYAASYLFTSPLPTPGTVAPPPLS